MPTTPEERADAAHLASVLERDGYTAGYLRSVAAGQRDTRAMPNGTERPGEHWNARLIREAAEAGEG